MSGPLDVLMVTPSLGLGGAERVCINLSSELGRRGHRVTVVALTRTGEMRDQLAAGVDFICLDARRALTAAVPLAALIRRRRPGLLCGFLPHANLSAALALRWSGVDAPLVVTEHAYLGGRLAALGNARRRIFKTLVGRTYRRADRVVAITEKGAQNVREVFGLGGERVTVIANPVFRPLSLARQARAPLRCAAAERLLAQSDYVVVAVGRLDPVKRFDLAIRALAAAAGRGALWVVGDGPELARLRALAGGLGLSDRVLFLGYQSNPLKFIAAADLLLLTSEREGFGNVLVEALACGTTPAAVACPVGPEEILDGGRYGYLCPADAGADALGRLIETARRRPLSPALLRERAAYRQIINDADRQRTLVAS